MGPAARRQKIRLGDLLINAGLIKQNQLDEALTMQKQDGKRLGEELIELG